MLAMTMMLSFATAVSVKSLMSVMSSVPTLLHNNPSFVLSTVLLVLTFGVTMEQQTTFGKAISVS